MTGSPSAPTPNSRPRFAGILRSAACLAIFAAALFATGEAIRRALPFPSISTAESKVLWLREHGDDYDTLFLGSSRTYHHIIPAIFDEVMTAAGFPTRSFNLGVDGMRPPEDSYLLETVLAQRRAPLKLVLLESNDIRVDVEDDARGTRRLEYWHDFKRLMVMARRTLWSVDYRKKSVARRVRNVRSGIGPFLDHLGPFLARATNVGRGPELVSVMKGEVTAPTPGGKLGARNDGYLDSDRPDEISKRDLAKLNKAIAALREKPDREDFSDPESQRVLREKHRWIADRGGRLMLVVPPIAFRNKFYPDPRFGTAPTVLDFNDPADYPELFEARHRQDAGHLNAAGAEIFTRLLAQRIIAELRRQRPAPAAQ